jgi:hypothetical protein
VLATALSVLPTAVHEFADGHDTLSRRLDFVPSGSGMCCTVHRLPSKCSTSANVSTTPTAVQLFVEAHDTLSRPLAPVFGVRSSDHSLPAQRSTSTRSRSAPMAMHADFDVHDTPLSTLNRGSFALRCVDHRLPFQRSISGLTLHGPPMPKQPSPLLTDPTAVQVPAETHDTLESESSLGRADEPTVGAI